jgi:hypothetical protein
VLPLHALSLFAGQPDAAARFQLSPAFGLLTPAALGIFRNRMYVQTMGAAQARALISDRNSVPSRDTRLGRGSCPSLGKWPAEPARASRIVHSSVPLGRQCGKLPEPPFSTWILVRALSQSQFASGSPPLMVWAVRDVLLSRPHVSASAHLLRAMARHFS